MSNNECWYSMETWSHYMLLFRRNKATYILNTVTAVGFEPVLPQSEHQRTSSLCHSLQGLLKDQIVPD